MQTASLYISWECSLALALSRPCLYWYSANQQSRYLIACSVPQRYHPRWECLHQPEFLLIFYFSLFVFSAHARAAPAWYYAAITKKAIRRKLVRSLRDEFHWPQSEQIEFYDDFLPYSFTFKEYRGGKAVMTGGLILHNQENISKSHYSIHTWESEECLWPQKNESIRDMKS